MSPTPETSTSDPIDPSFVFDFRTYDEPLAGHQRWSTWLDVEPLCRGPEPRPDWVVTDRAAVDTELGILKTGKEADVFLLERAVEGGPAVVMAAKRYRSTDHRNFHRNGRLHRRPSRAGQSRGPRCRQGILVRPTPSRPASGPTPSGSR